MESWALRDDLSALRQLGILPTALIRYSAVGGTHAGAARAAGGNGSPRRRPSVIKHTVSSVAFIAACVLRSTVAR